MSHTTLDAHDPAAHTHPDPAAPALHHTAAASLPGVAGGSRGLTHSVLGWSAWQRVLAVLPVLLLLWLAVRWAAGEVPLW